MLLIIFAIPPFFIFFIMRCMSSNCFRRRLTSCTCIPQPAAIRRLREPLMISGLARSFIVIELMMASIRTSTLSSICDLTLSGICPMPGSLPIKLAMPPIFFICRSCSRKSLRSKPSPFFSLLANFSACARSTLLSISSISDSTSPMPRIRDAMRSGWNGSSASVFSPTPRNLIGLPVM